VVLDDIEDECKFLIWSVTLDEARNLRVPKPKPLEIKDNDQRHMYCARVSEGDMPLIPVGPPLCCLVPERAGPGEGGDASEGPRVIDDDIEEFVEDVVRELIDGILEHVVVSVPEEVACEVCFKEDALDIWELWRCDMV
jgi:hypothetical protein